MNTIREKSRAELDADFGANVNWQPIFAGCLQRIADACEVMCKDRETLERDLKWEKERSATRKQEVLRLERSNRSLRALLRKAKGAK